MPLEGLQLGKYRLVRLIGSGGMGDIYIGEDARLSRQLAIKVMRAEVSPYPDEDTVKAAARLFQRELKAIARLDHPHILPLYDYGEEIHHQTTLIYMVMPFRPEGSLADWLRQRNTIESLPLQDIASLVSQASEALQYAHDHQIIHQDVKLSNFLCRRKKDVSSPPDLQLADFGIAKISSATSSMSHASRGTPIYMAPEQWNGDPVPATDQYALAIMTYELLTGRPPFRGRPEQMMFQHLTVSPPPPSTFRKDLPASIDAVLLRALAKKPEERFPSISEFAVAFQQAMQNIGDLYATLAISEGEAATGTKRELTLPGGRKAQVSIPQGAQDKQVLRIEGLGEPYYAGGPPGALVLTLTISAQDRTAFPEEAVYEETVASSSPPNDRSETVLTSSSSTSSSKAPPSLPPTQYALPPAIAPTQLAKSASQPAARASVSSSPLIPQDKSVTQPASERQATPKRPEEKVRVWSIGRRQIVAMVIGIILYGISLYALHLLIINSFYGSSPLYNPFFSFPSNIFTPIDILFGLTFVTPLFLSARFGPWTGLATAVGGFLLEGLFLYNYDILYGGTAVGGYAVLGFGPSWYLVLAGYAAFGFIPGLALLLSRGRGSKGTIGIAVGMSAIGIVIGSAFLAWNESLSPFFPAWLIHFLSCIINLILLPILFLIYDAFANRRMKV